MANFGTLFSHFITILTIVAGTFCACQEQDGPQGIPADECSLQDECDGTHMTLRDFVSLTSSLTPATPDAATLALFPSQTDAPTLIPIPSGTVLFATSVGSDATLAFEETSTTLPTSPAQTSTADSSTSADVAALAIVCTVAALGGAAIALCIVFICLRRRRSSRANKIKPIDIERDGTAGSKDPLSVAAFPLDTSFANTSRSNDLKASRKTAGMSENRAPRTNPTTDQLYVLGYNTDRRRNTMAFIGSTDKAQDNVQYETVLEDRRSERMVQLSVGNANNEGDESDDFPSGASMPPPEYLSIFPTRKGKFAPQQGKKGIAM